MLAKCAVAYTQVYRFSSIRLVDKTLVDLRLFVKDFNNFNKKVVKIAPAGGSFVNAGARYVNAGRSFVNAVKRSVKAVRSSIPAVRNFIVEVESFIVSLKNLGSVQKSV